MFAIYFRRVEKKDEFMDEQRGTDSMTAQVQKNVNGRIQVRVLGVFTKEFSNFCHVPMFA